MIETVRFAIFRNIGVDQKELATFHRGIGVAQATASSAQRFHFRSLQLDPGLICIENFVIKARSPIVGDQLSLLFIGAAWFGPGGPLPSGKWFSNHGCSVQETGVHHGFPYLLLADFAWLDQRQAHIGPAEAKQARRIFHRGRAGLYE
jgi:hypothetical protein